MNFLKDKYLKNIAKIFSANSLIQLIPAIGILLLARIFNPEGFGLFAAWSSFVYIGLNAAILKLEVSIFDEVSNSRMKAVQIMLFVSFILSAIIGLGVSIIFYIIEYTQFNMLDIIFGTTAVFLLAAYRIWTLFLTAEAKFDNLIILRLINAAAVLVFQIIFGLYNPVYTSLIIGFIIAHIITLFFAQIIHPITFSIQVDNIVVEVKKYFKKHIRYPLFSLPSEIVSSVSAQIPFIILLSKYGPDLTGQFAMAFKILGVPMGFVGKAVGDVFRQKSAEDYKEINNCRSTFNKTFLLLSSVSLISALFTWNFISPIVLMVFGSEWELAGTICIFLIPLFAMNLIVSPLTFTLYVVQKQHIDLLWQLILIIGVYFCLTMAKDFNTSIIYYSTTYSLLYILLLPYLYYISGELSKNRNL
tara:strand:+ start:175 stop:1422 length:1248 start_codon:yes stop_codon:yes gene_type:complete